MKPWTTLQKRYVPSRWRAWRIGRDLTALTKKAGLIPLEDDAIQRNPKAAWSNYDLHAEVRKTAVPGSEGTGWHHDGDTSSPSGMHCGLVVWANRTPTQILFEGEVYQPEPFEVVLVDNMAATHRRPPNAPARRWMFRQRVEMP